MYKKGDLVEVVSLLPEDEFYGVRVGMIAKVVGVLEHRQVTLCFKDKSVRHHHCYPMCDFLLRMYRPK